MHALASPGATSSIKTNTSVPTRWTHTQCMHTHTHSDTGRHLTESSFTESNMLGCSHSNYTAHTIHTTPMTLHTHTRWTHEVYTHAVIPIDICHRTICMGLTHDTHDTLCPLDTHSVYTHTAIQDDSWQRAICLGDDSTYTTLYAHTRWTHKV